MPNYVIDFTNNPEEADVHATERMKMTRSGKPVICHICGKNHYENMLPDREENAQGKKVDKVEDTSKKERPPTKASVNMMSGEDWGDNTNYGGLMLCQVTAENANNKDQILEYQHTLSQSVGHIIPTRVLLDTHSTVDVFSNIRLLNNTRKSD